MIVIVTTRKKRKTKEKKTKTSIQVTMMSNTCSQNCDCCPKKNGKKNLT
jgi:hypothetical protein